MFFQKKKSHWVASMFAGVAVGMTVMGAVCLMNDKCLCKKLKKEAMNVGNMVKQGVENMF